MKVCIETITPEIAREYLTKNTNNYRSIIPHIVAKYANDMKDGLWDENGSAIVFSKSGTLLDGQHRLNAVIRACMPVSMVVVRDVSDQVSSFDTQSKRSESQVLKASGIDGYARTLQASSVAGMLLSRAYTRNGPAGKQVSIQKIRRFLKAKEAEMDAVASAVFSGNSVCAKRASVLCAAWCLFEIGESMNNIRQFFSVVNSGFPVDGKECSPCIVLRNHLLNTKGLYIHTKASVEKDFSMTIRAYLDFKNGALRRTAYKDSTLVSSKYFNYACEKAQEYVEE